MKIKKALILIFISFSVIVCGSCRYFNSDPTISLTRNMENEIGQIINTMDDNGQFSGAVLVSVKGKIIYKNAVGYANIEDSIPNTCDTKFRIASFTKPFTVMLVLQLVDEGKLKLDGKLTEYLPEFPKEKGEDITIHQLLTHTSGITGESRIPNLIDIEKEYYTREELFNCIVEQDIVFMPGRGREYSNFGFALLGLIIEKVSGKSYDELLQEKICKPAGMKNTLGDVTALPIENRAIGYNYNYFTGLEKASFLDMSFVFGYGHLLSTVNDLYLFDKALYSNKLLNEKSKDLFFNKYGWHYQQCPYGKGSKRIRSNSLDGSINGFGSHTQRIEKDTVFIVALRNTKEYKNQIVIKWPSFMISRILAVVYGEEYDMPKKSAAFEVFKTLNESGSEKAKERYYYIKQNLKDQFYFENDEFVKLSQELIDVNLVNEAAEFQNILVTNELAKNTTYKTGFVKDIDNNIYKTIKIGKQWWMAENLKVTRNPDGEKIKSYFYNDDSITYAKYGRLYTWDVAMNFSESENTQGISPQEWHLPSEADWDELVHYLGGEDDVGRKIAVGGEAGFEAILSGGADYKGNYVYFGEYAMYWSSTSIDEERAYHMGIGKKNQWDKFAAKKNGRIHVRCIKDD